MTTPCNLTDENSVLSCLKNHLQATCAVEFYTIPLYLTAVYSYSIAAANSEDKFIPENSCQPTNQMNFFWWMQQQALSVVIQEMYHLQCAANLTNAFDVHPQLEPADFTWQGPVPHLPNVKLLKLDNLPNVLSVLKAIEQPDLSGEFQLPNMEVEYDSISDLYHAMLTLLETYLTMTKDKDPVHFVSDKSQMEYLTFSNRYQYTIIKHKDDIAHLANAICFQGEGAAVTKDFKIKFPLLASLLTSDSVNDNKQIPSQYQPTSSSRFARWDCWNHHYRFVNLSDMLTGANYADAEKKLPEGRKVFNVIGAEDPDRPAWVPTAKTIQSSLDIIYSYVFDLINQGMIKGGGLDSDDQQITFTQAMTAFKYLIPQLWQWGKAPSFNYQAGVNIDKVQTAMDQADPLCLYHWDSATVKLRNDHPNELNVCQGLNNCSGRGWGALSTQAGDGACATLDIHTCVDGNSCKDKGACGFIATDSKNNPYACDDLWAPGQNSCNGKGGCQVPISTKQVFSGVLPPSCNKQNLSGASVWDEARALLAKKIEKKLPVPISKQTKNGTDYDGNKRRSAIFATST